MIETAVDYLGFTTRITKTAKELNELKERLVALKNGRRPLSEKLINEAQEANLVRTYAVEGQVIVVSPGDNYSGADISVTEVINCDS